MDATERRPIADARRAIGTVEIGPDGHRRELRAYGYLGLPIWIDIDGPSPADGKHVHRDRAIPRG